MKMPEAQIELCLKRLGFADGVGFGGFHRQHNGNLLPCQRRTGDVFQAARQHVGGFLVIGDNNHMLHSFPGERVESGVGDVTGVPIGMFGLADAAQSAHVGQPGDNKAHCRVKHQQRSDSQQQIREKQRPQHTKHQHHPGDQAGDSVQQAFRQARARGFATQPAQSHRYIEAPLIARLIRHVLT